VDKCKHVRGYSRVIYEDLLVDRGRLLRDTLGSRIGIVLEERSWVVCASRAVSGKYSRTKVWGNLQLKHAAK
jgi:hypothetical protein